MGIMDRVEGGGSHCKECGDCIPVVEMSSFACIKMVKMAICPTLTLICLNIVC